MIDLLPTNVCEPYCSLHIAGDEQTRLVTMLKAAGNSVRFEILKFLVATSLQTAIQ